MRRATTYGWNEGNLVIIVKAVKPVNVLTIHREGNAVFHRRERRKRGTERPPEVANGRLGRHFPWELRLSRVFTQQGKEANTHRHVLCLAERGPRARDTI